MTRWLLGPTLVLLLLGSAPAASSDAKPESEATKATAVEHPAVASGPPKPKDAAVTASSPPDSKYDPRDPGAPELVISPGTRGLKPEAD